MPCAVRRADAGSKTRLHEKLPPVSGADDADRRRCLYWKAYRARARSQVFLLDDAHVDAFIAFIVSSIVSNERETMLEANHNDDDPNDDDDGLALDAVFTVNIHSRS